MLASLRLDRFIGGNDEEDQINSTHSGEHVANKFFVTGNIDKTESHAFEIQKSKPQVNRDPAALFFFQSVRVGAGESLDQRGLAMIDVSCRTDNYMLDVFHEGNAICTLML